MADDKNVFAFKPRVKLNRYVLHTDNPDVRKANSSKMDPEKHGFVPVHTYDNGVKEHVEPDGGSGLFVHHAANIKEARAAIHGAMEKASTRDKAAFDQKMGQGDVLFQRGMAEIKPFKPKS
jgi:hypothetical protein